VKVVVTGATGYVGGVIVEQLISQGNEVAAVVRALSDLLPVGVQQIVDTGDDAFVLSEFQSFGVEVVIHCAAHQDLNHSLLSSANLIETNLGFAGRMLAIAELAGVTGFVAAGTFATHADGTNEYAPQNLYAATKQAFNALAEHYRRNTEMSVVVLELSDTYGPNDPRPKFLTLVKKAASSQQTLDASPGLQVLNPIHVDDVARAFLHAANLLIDGVELAATYCVHGTEAVTLQELVSIYESVHDLKVNINWGGRQYREGEIMKPFVGEPLPSWQPTISLSVGLRQI
jgi:CDP-3, 6-dideoxy-D-glycero-L-glycero-4-hexulose-4-reductase